MCRVQVQWQIHFYRSPDVVDWNIYLYVLHLRTPKLLLLVQACNSALHKIVECKIYFHHTLGKYGHNVGGECGYSSKTWCETVFFHSLVRWVQFFLMAMYQSVMLSCLPADGLFLISDACLPECTIRLFQAKSNSSLQVIFIIPSQVDHIYTNTKVWEDTSYTFMVYT